MIALRSFWDRLIDELQEIEAAIVGLWRQSFIEEFHNDPYSGIAVIAPRYHWKPLLPAHRTEQAQILERYTHWRELFGRCHLHHSSDIQQEIQRAHENVMSAIELRTGWSTEATVEQNAAHLAHNLSIFRQIFAPPESGARDLLIPDTNALLMSADPMPTSLTRNGSILFLRRPCSPNWTSSNGSERPSR